MEKSNLVVENLEVFSLQSIILQDFLAIWRAKLDGRQMPCRKDFDLLELAPVMWPHVLLIDVLPGDMDRFRYRLIGSHIVDALARNVTGQIIDEIQSSTDYDMFVEGFRWSVKHQKSMQSNGSAIFVNKDWIAYESLILPLSEDGSTVNMLLVPAVFTVDPAYARS